MMISYEKLGKNEEFRKYLKQNVFFLDKILKYKSHPENSMEADAMNERGMIFLRYRFYMAAEIDLLNSLHLRVDLYGDEHSDVINSLNNLGYLYQNIRNFPKALIFHSKSLKIRQTLGKECSDYVDIMINISFLHFNMGNFPVAEKKFLGLFDFTKKYFGQKHPKTADLFDKMGNLYKLKGEYPKAEKYYLESLEIRKNLKNHSDIAISQNNLGLLYRKMGNFPKAKEFFMNCLETCQTVFSEDCSEVIMYLNNLGNLYHRMRNFSEAKRIYLKCLNFSLRLGFPFEKAFSQNNLGNLYTDMGKFRKAEKILLKSLETSRRIYGENTHIFEPLDSLGSLHENMGNDSEAEKIYLNSLEIKQKFAGENSQRLLTTLDSLVLLYYKLAIFYNKMENFQKAKEVEKNALIIRENIFGENNEDVAEGLFWLGNVYFHLKNFPEAKKTYWKSLEIYKKNFGENYMDMEEKVTILMKLVYLYKKIGKPSRAEKFLLKSLEMSQKIYGENDLFVAKILDDLGCFYKNQGNLLEAEKSYLNSLKIEIMQTTQQRLHLH